MHRDHQLEVRIFGKILIRSQKYGKESLLVGCSSTNCSLGSSILRHLSMSQMARLAQTQGMGHPTSE